LEPGLKGGDIDVAWGDIVLHSPLPAVCPKVMIVHCRRQDEAAMCEKLATRLAINRFRVARGKRQR
jgi:hypothetical protein